MLLETNKSRNNLDCEKLLKIIAEEVVGKQKPDLKKEPECYCKK